MGPRKPAEGETVSHHLPAKDERGNDHMIHMQVYNKGGDNKPYELNTYSSKVPKRHVKEDSEQIDELSTPTLSSYVKKRGAQLGGGSTDRPKITGMNAALRKIKLNASKKAKE